MLFSMLGFAFVLLCIANIDRKQRKNIKPKHKQKNTTATQNGTLNTQPAHTHWTYTSNLCKANIWPPEWKQPLTQNIQQQVYVLFGCFTRYSLDEFRMENIRCFYLLCVHYQFAFFSLSLLRFRLAGDTYIRFWMYCVGCWTAVCVLLPVD